MSYRNPQIIVDRSAEVWADTINKIGEIGIKTIQDYSSIRAKAAADLKKETENVGVFIGKSEEKQRAWVESVRKDFKGEPGEWEKFQKEITGLGKSILPLQVQNSLDTSLTREQRDSNNEKIDEFNNYRQAKLDAIGGLYEKAGVVKDRDVDSSNYGMNLIANGDTRMERFDNLIAGFVTAGEKTQGISGKRNDTGEGRSEIMGVDYSIEPEQYKEFVEKGLLDKGALGKPDDKGNYNGRWERNLIKFGESKEGFFRKVFQEENVNAALEHAGFIDPKTGEFTNKNLATEMNTEVINGKEYTRQHVNPDGIYKNDAYRGAKMGEVEAVLSLGGEETFYIANKMLGGKLKKEKWTSTVKSEKAELLYQLMFEQDMSRLMKLPDGELPETRIANGDDVAYYEQMKWDPIVAGEDHVWFRTHGIKAVKGDPAGTEEGTKKGGGKYDKK